MPKPEPKLLIAFIAERCLHHERVFTTVVLFESESLPEEMKMKQVVCHQMRVISEEELALVYGGLIEAGSLADRVKNGAQRVLSGSVGCYAGAQRAAQGRNPGRYQGPRN